MFSGKSTHNRPIALLILIALFLVLAPTTYAQTKTFNWTNWDIDMVLQPDGSLEVTETQTLNFQGEPFTFGFRSIPVGRQGNNDGISNISVREGDQVFRESSSNAPGTFEVIDDGGETRINWYFEPAIGEHTYTFAYTVHGAVRSGAAEEGSGDQIFWTVIPSDHPATVNSIRATITLPEGIAPQRLIDTNEHLVEAYFNEVATDSVLINVSEDERVITYEANLPLTPGNSFDVRVQFPTGLLAAAAPEWQIAEQRSDAIGLGVLALSLLLLVVGPLGVVLLWYMRGRDPQLGIVVPDYITEPPDALPPAMVGSLIDEKVDMQDIMSTLVDLAHRGYVIMEEEKKSFTFIRTDKQDVDLRGFENKFLKDVFRGDNSRTLNSLQYKFAGNIPALRNMIIDDLIDKGYLPHSPQSVRSRYTWLAALVFGMGIAGLFLFGILLGERNAGLVCFPVGAIIISAIALFIAARHMPRKTAKGAEATAKWLAFKKYLQNIKQYADIENSNEIFEKYLAYAIAFGLERSFINTFSQSPTTAVPPWFIPYPTAHVPGPMGGMPRPSSGTSGGGSSSGGGMPNLGDVSGGLTGGLAGMSAGLTRMLNNTSNVLKSTPPPANTGSSRSGGGGFSGGFSGGSSGGGGSAGFG